jgi:hypothetical protein
LSAANKTGADLFGGGTPAPGRPFSLEEAKMARNAKSEQPAYSAQKVRQGEIILRKPWERGLFIAGLALPFVIVLLLMLFHH